MKRFISKIVAFSLMFITINVMYLVLLVFTDWNFKKRIESLNLDNPDYELLILGNSLAMDGFDTGLLTSCGLKSYNLAIDGGSLKTSYIQLTEYLAQYKTEPAYLILGLGSFMGSFEGEAIHPIVEFTMKDYKFTFNDLPIVKFQWLGAEVAKKIVSSTHRNAILSAGQLKFQKKVPDNTNYSDRTFNIEYYKASFYTGEIARLCHIKRIKLIIIEMPGYHSTQNDTEIGPVEISFSNGCRAYLYNLNSKEFCRIFNSTEDWIGNSHLNEFGAIKFTRRMMNVVFGYRLNGLDP